jgi:hypothetical protein
VPVEAREQSPLTARRKYSFPEAKLCKFWVTALAPRHQAQATRRIAASLALGDLGDEFGQLGEDKAIRLMVVQPLATVVGLKCCMGEHAHRQHFIGGKEDAQLGLGRVNILFGHRHCGFPTRGITIGRIDQAGRQLALAPVNCPSPW